LLFVCLPEGFSPFTMCFSVPSEKNGPTGCRSMNRQELGDETKQTTRYRGSQDQCSHCHWSLVIYLVNIYIYVYLFIRYITSVITTYVYQARIQECVSLNICYIYTVVIFFAWMKHILEDVLDFIVICANRLLFNWWIYETIFDLAVWTVPNRTPKQGVPKWLVWCSAVLFLAIDKAIRVLGI
jgi:hypothetical protein